MVTSAEKLKAFIDKAEKELEKYEREGKKSFNALKGKAKHKKNEAEEFIKKNPLLVVGGAVVLGYILGRIKK